MNIFNKTKNNIKFTYYRLVSIECIRQMKKHMHDEDDAEFKRWGNLELQCLRKMLEIKQL